MNKSAKELFEELGYIFAIFSDNEIVYSLYDGNVAYDKNFYSIRFNLENEDIWVDDPVSPNVIKAINQQCKELGWLDE